MLSKDDAEPREARSASKRDHVQCASLKANAGHLEASAAAGGLAALLVTAVLQGLIAVNAQLRRS